MNFGNTLVTGFGDTQNAWSHDTHDESIRLADRTQVDNKNSPSSERYFGWVAVPEKVISLSNSRATVSRLQINTFVATRLILPWTYHPRDVFYARWKRLIDQFGSHFSHLGHVGKGKVHKWKFVRFCACLPNIWLQNPKNQARLRRKTDTLRHFDHKIDAYHLRLMDLKWAA